MPDMRSIIYSGLLIFVIFKVITASDCPNSDPDCHPLCIEYIGPCKFCRCNGGTSSGGGSNRWSGSNNGSGSNSGSGSSRWSGSNSGTGSSRWSGSNSGSGSTSSDKWNSEMSGNSNKWEPKKNKGNAENTKVVIIHETDTQTNQLTSLPGLPMSGHMPFNMPHGPMAPQNPFVHHTSSSHRTMNVPLKSPGIPKYCVSIDKMEFENCPCTVVDENVCLTCPCFSASRFWIAVRTKASKPKPKEKKECVGTLLCMMSCKGGYHLGETGPDGCQSCTCLKTEEKTHPPKKTEKECLKVYECIIKCSQKKLGFTVGEETSNGCRSCKCLMEEHSTGGSSGYKWTTGSGGSNAGNTNGDGGHKWATGSGGSYTGNSNGDGGHKWATGSGGSNTGNSNGGGNNFLKSPEKGVGTGGGGGTKLKCNPPMVQCTNDGNTLMQTMGGGGGGSGANSGSGSSGDKSGGGGPFNPMSGGNGSGAGMKRPFNPMSGGNGSGAGMKSPFSPSSGGSGSGSGMTSPFGSGSGGGMKSPFAGGGPGKGMGSGPGLGGGVGPHGPQAPGFPSQKKVEKAAYNENCFGPSCSAKDGGLVEGTLQNDLFMGSFKK